MSRPAVVIRMDAARTHGNAIAITVGELDADAGDAVGIRGMTLEQAKTLRDDLEEAIYFVDRIQEKGDES